MKIMHGRVVRELVPGNIRDRATFIGRLAECLEGWTEVGSGTESASGWSGPPASKSGKGKADGTTESKKRR